MRPLSSINQMYRWLEERIPSVAPWLHLPLFFLSLTALDLGFRWMCRFAQAVGLVNTLKLMPFTLGWALLLTGIAALLPRLLRRVWMGLISAAATVLCVVHGVFINMFRKFFSFSDMAFAGDGAAFADTSYFVIRKLLLAWIILCFLLAVLAVLLVPPGAGSKVKGGAALAVTGLAVIG